MQSCARQLVGINLQAVVHGITVVMQFTLLGLGVVVPHRHLCSGIPLVLIEEVSVQSSITGTKRDWSRIQILD